MANKKYILREVRGSFDTAAKGIETNLMNLSLIGIKWNQSLIKQARGIGAEESQASLAGRAGEYSGIYNANDDGELFLKQSSIAGQNDYVPYFDKNYSSRRDFLRKFALSGEIEMITEAIADEVIVNDDSHYFAYLDTKQLKTILKTSDQTRDIIKDFNMAYHRIFYLFHWNESNDAWHYVKKFLIDGFLAFEIIYSTERRKNEAKDIIGFQELDPITLKPEIRRNDNGEEYKVWIQNEGDATTERIIPDVAVIFISWTKNNFVSRLSYVERLVRSFNMLRTIENSRIIWNVQNAQKRVKFVVPIGTQSEPRARTRLNQLEAYYKEDIVVDNDSGEMTVNGQPKFSFFKTFFFPSRDGASTEISEIGTEGYDMNSTEQLKYFWKRFMIETKLPASRFEAMFGNEQSGGFIDNQSLTREEYKFSLFINRIRAIFQEILIKPTWIQFCLKHPEFSTNNILKSGIGLKWVSENIFTLAKERENASTGANTIQTLSNLMGPDGKPYFSSKFLIEKYMGLNSADLELNAKYREIELENAKNEGEEQEPVMGGMSSGMGMGDGMYGGGSFGGPELPETPMEAPTESPAEAPTESPAEAPTESPAEAPVQ